MAFEVMTYKGFFRSQRFQIVLTLNSFAVLGRFAQRACFMINTLVRNKDLFGLESIFRNLGRMSATVQKCELFL